MLQLVLMQDGQSVNVPLDHSPISLGRLPECDVKLNSNMVSRRHAELAIDGSTISIRDLGSGNGTFVNGNRLGEDAAVLKAGDRIKLGPILIRVDSEDGQIVPPDDESVRGTHVVGKKPKSKQQPPAEQKATDQEFVVNPSPPPMPSNITATIAEAPDDDQMIRGSSAVSGGVGLLEKNPAEKLRGVIEITKSLSGSFDAQTILPKILDSLFNIFPAADRGFIFMKDIASGEIVQRAANFRRDEDDSFRMSRTIRDKVLNDREAVLSADASSDSRFSGAESLMGMSIRSMMCVPMLDREGAAIGLINIDTTNQLQSFSEDDLELMVAVAGQASMLYQSALLLASYVQKQKQDNEMAIAEDVQHALLPEKLPDMSGYEMFASYDSAQAVGGDYYDSFPLKDGRICIAFGDVAGKGVPASLVMSRLSSVVRSTMQHVDEVAEAISAINDHMCARAVEGRFVTFFLGLLDPETGEMAYANAGHMPLMVRHTDGSVDEYGEEEIGVPIGVLSGYPYDAVKYTLQPGDCIVLYTDGVSEAMNHESDLYTIEHLRDFLSKSSGTAQEIGVAIREDVRRHADGREQNDDVTMMLITRA